MNYTEYYNYPDLSHVKRVLVIIFKNIGDVVLTSPVFSVLRNALPGTVIDVALNSGTEEVLIDNPNINIIHILDRKTLIKGGIPHLKEELRFYKAIRTEKYDLSIILSAGDRGKHVGLLSGAKTRVGFASSKNTPVIGKHFLTIEVGVPGNRHCLERYLDCLRRLGIFPGKHQKAPIFFEGKDARSMVNKLIENAGISSSSPYIVVHPTSRWMFKCWPHENISELIDIITDNLQIPVVLTSGPDTLELSYIQNVLDRLNSNVINMAGKLSLKELGALLRGAKLFIGVDSAPMHIATAVNTPAIALFGPTSEVEWGPLGEEHQVITSTTHTCRPCNRDGCGGSKKSECMESIKVETVYTKVEATLLKA